MSLDVYLKIPGKTSVTGARIFVREDGQNKALSRDEWDARFPDREPYMNTETLSDDVYSANITHNLNKMAGEAGIYEVPWRPEETGITHARQLVEPLTKGLEMLRSDPKRFAAFNPSNGWGSYDGFVEFVAEYLAACEANPEADVSVSR